MCNLAAVALMVSWILPITRAWWDSLDTSIFYYFNRSLDGPQAWQTLWAITNWRPFDLVSGGTILAVYLLWLRLNGKDNFVRGVTALFLIFVVLIITKQSLHEVLDAFDLERASPTRYLDNTIRLSKSIDWIEVKDDSKSCFPGDHAFVLIVMTVFFWAYGSWRLGSLASLLFTPFMLPRIVVGAHWVTDILVGTVFMALIAMSWWLATPAHIKLVNWASHRVEKPLMFVRSILDKHFRLWAP